MTHNTDPTVVLGIVALVGSFSLVHLARRYPTTRNRFVPSGDSSFTLVQRALHWTIGIGSGALFFTGLPVYLAQFLVSPPVPTPIHFSYWGLQVLQWRDAHIYLALAIVAFVSVHALWDTVRLGRLGSLSVSRVDAREAWNRSLQFLGVRGGPYKQPTARYDLFHKAYHWTLLALGGFLLVSGLLEWEALTWQGVPLFVLLDRWNHVFIDDFMRTGHLVAAMLFAGLVVIHIYFAILPQNRPFLRSITTGSRSGSSSAPGYSTSGKNLLDTSAEP